LFNKNTLLIAIVPAIIAGAFSISPKLYDIVMSTDSKLTYSILSGPTVKKDKNYGRVAAIKIRNDGDKSLTNVRAVVSLETASIDTFQVDESTGITTEITTKEGELLINTPQLHKKEELVLSIMYFGPDKEEQLVVTLRSDETLGDRHIGEQKETVKKLDETFLGSILAAVSVFMMVTLFLSGRAPFFLAIIGSKNDTLYFIAARLGITPVAKTISNTRGVIKYLHTADLFLAFGLSGGEAEKEKASLALKSMLLIKTIAQSSQDIIVQNLITLEDNMSADEIKLIKSNSTGIGNQETLRKNINEYCSNPVTFLTRLKENA
jgi:hypothetical protein